MPPPAHPPVRLRRIAVLSLALCGLTSAIPAPAAEVASSDSTASAAAAATTSLVNLRLPRAQARTVAEVWRRAAEARESGRSAEAASAYRELVSLLEQAERSAPSSLAVIEAKAHLHAEALGDRSAARREVDRALARDPLSPRAQALARQLTAEESAAIPPRASDGPAVVLSPRSPARKGPKP